MVGAKKPHKTCERDDYMIVTVLRSRLKANVEAAYGPLAAHMSELASSIPGYVSHKGFVAEDGERVTIVEFESDEALREWKSHPEHMNAKKRGFAEFYSNFRYQVCNVVHSRVWQSQSSH